MTDDLRERLTAWGRDLTNDDELWVSIDNAIGTVALWLYDVAAALASREGDPNLWADEQQAYVDAAATLRRLVNALVPDSPDTPTYTGGIVFGPGYRFGEEWQQ